MIIGDLFKYYVKIFSDQRIQIQYLISFFGYCLNERFPDLMLVFTNSLRGDIESFLTGVPFRFGVSFNEKKRPLITHLEKG